MHTPAGNNITNLYTDYHGYLWVQYDNREIDRYDPSTGIFHHISNQLSFNNVKSKINAYTLIVDHQDNLWMSGINSGFYRYNFHTKQIQHFSQATGLLNDTSRAVVEDHAGKIWMVTQKGN